MSFRDQKEHLQHKAMLLERQLEEERQRASEERRARRKKFWATFWRRTKSVLEALFITTAVAGAIFGAYRSWLLLDEQKVQEQQARRDAHRHLLQTMRQNIPSDVPERTWLWCVDHCARFGRHGSSHPYSEGVVIDTFLDYRQDPPAQLVTISGPWLDAQAKSRVSHSLEAADVDPPGARFAVGDVVRITEIRGKYTDYTFRRLHPEGL